MRSCSMDTHRLASGKPTGRLATDWHRSGEIKSSFATLIARPFSIVPKSFAYPALPGEGLEPTHLSIADFESVEFVSLSFHLFPNSLISNRVRSGSLSNSNVELRAVSGGDWSRTGEMADTVTIRPHRGGPQWEIDYLDPQTHKRVRRKVGPKKVAQRLKAQVEAELAMGRVGISPWDRITLGELWGHWLADRTRRGKRSLKVDRSRWPIMLAILGGPDRKASTIRVADIDHLRAELQKRATVKTPATRNRYLALLRAMLRLAERHELIQKAPFVELEREERDERETWSAEQLAIAFKESDPRERLMFLVLRDTGFRVSEAARLSWDRVHLDENGLSWVRAPNRAKSRKSANREVPIVDVVTIRHLMWAKRTATSEWVFPGSMGHIPPATFSSTMHRFRKRAGIVGVTTHDLRHTRATELAGILTATDLADFMGHESIQTTRIYTHRKAAQLAEALKGGRKLA